MMKIQSRKEWRLEVLDPGRFLQSDHMTNTNYHPALFLVNIREVHHLQAVAMQNIVLLYHQAGSSERKKYFIQLCL